MSTWISRIVAGIVSFATACLMGFVLGAPASAHGGGLDWQGGHNCRVGSCAGTYHCHQPRGGICAASSKPNVTKPKTSPTKYSTCRALRIDYPRGVAKWTETANAAVKYGSRKPSVKKSIYNANRGLDYDRDGVICDVR